ncbi:MAG: DNA polymerase III subunit beta [Candidatus Magasanikbacteria bacterium]|nr:DNA polymerase III subunit beta [Candidatus Magasanikbacteria bacterium]
MKFSCLRENLSTTLSLVSGLTGKSSHLPVLGHVLITADQQKVEVSATNLEMALTATVRAKAETAGAATVPASTLGDVVRLFGEDKLTIELINRELIIAGVNTNTKLRSSAAEDFPIIPPLNDGQGYTVSAAELAAAVRATLVAAAKNDVRPELAGILFAWLASPPRLVLAATDSYRLAEFTIPLSTAITQDFKVIVPARAAQEIQRILTMLAKPEGETEAQLLFNEHQLLLTWQNVRLTSRLVAGEFPDYRQIIPAAFPITIQAPVGQLINEVKAAGLFTTSGINAISLSSQDNQSITISASAAQTGEYRSTLPAQIEGKPISVLLNHHYLLDGLTHLPAAEARLQFVDAESPGLLTPAGGQSAYRYLIMPIRQ